MQESSVMHMTHMLDFMRRDGFQIAAEVPEHSTILAQAQVSVFEKT